MTMYNITYEAIGRHTDEMIITAKNPSEAITLFEKLTHCIQGINFNYSRYAIMNIVELHTF